MALSIFEIEYTLPNYLRTYAPAIRRSLYRRLGLAREDNGYLATVEQGSAAPRMKGSSWHYETKGGRYIRHPSAYSKHGWSNMVYVGADRELYVGAGWFLERAMAMHERDQERARARAVSKWRPRPWPAWRPWRMKRSAMDELTAWILAGAPEVTLAELADLQASEVGGLTIEVAFLLETSDHPAPSYLPSAMP